MRSLLLITLTCSLLAAATMTAGAASRQRADIPACEELLTRRQAAAAMDVKEALIALRDVEGSTRYCSWFGASPARLDRSIAVRWGPYSDYRKYVIVNGRTVICAVSKPACKALKKSLKEKSNLRSFGYFAVILNYVGIAKRLPSSAFEGNPAFVWDPSTELTEETKLGPTTWVFVYDVASQSLLSVLCGSVSEPPGHPCAIEGAKRAYNNITG